MDRVNVNGVRVELLTQSTERIETMRSIVQEHQWVEIDGMVVDVVTASAYVTVWDALSPKNATHLDSLLLSYAVSVVWKVLEKVKA